MSAGPWLSDHRIYMMGQSVVCLPIRDYLITVPIWWVSQLYVCRSVTIWSAYLYDESVNCMSAGPWLSDHCDYMMSQSIVCLPIHDYLTTVTIWWVSQLYVCLSVTIWSPWLYDESVDCMFAEPWLSNELVDCMSTKYICKTYCCSFYLTVLKNIL